MKKLILIPALFLFLNLIFPNIILAQGSNLIAALPDEGGGGGTFSCYWSGLGCAPQFTGCRSGYQGDSSFCSNFKTVIDCSGKQSNCIKSPSTTSSTSSVHGDCGDTGVNTAIGCIPYDDPSAFAGFFVGWGIGIGGGIAFLLTLYAGFMIMTSSGNPERLKAGQELLTSALAGIIMIIFSVFLLRLIGVNILGIFK